MAYASGTKVASSVSRDQLEKLLRARGATGFMYGWDDAQGHATILCRISERLIRLSVKSPDPDDFRRTPTGKPRTSAAVATMVADEERRLWRSLLLVVKARMVAIDDGVETFESAFLPWIVLPDGRTVAEWLGPQLAEAYETHEMPSMLPEARPMLTSGGV
jgi:hypothetical protein